MTAAIHRNAPAPLIDVPLLQWASGRTEARPVSGGRFAGFVGFHAERGKDSALDAACEAAGTPQMELRHNRNSGQPALVTHWAFGETLRFYPITAGPPATTISGCLRLAEQTAAAGLGLAWPSGDKSRMAVRGLVLIGDAPIVLQLSARSTMTDYLLAALLDHIRACEAADSMIDRVKHPELVALHELCLPLKAGQETSVGSAETTLITPFISAHPAEMDKAYVSSCWRKSALHALAIEAWPGIVAWASGYGSGETNGDSHVEDGGDRPLARGVKRVYHPKPIADVPL